MDQRLKCFMKFSSFLKDFSAKARNLSVTKFASSFFAKLSSHKNKWRRGGLMVSALISGLGGPGSSPGRGTALFSRASSHCASLHPGVQMGTGEFTTGGNPAMDLYAQSACFEL